MFAQLFSTMISSVGLAALVVSSLVLLLNASRDVFEVDLRTLVSPLGEPVTYFEWKYDGDVAQDCRRDIVLFMKTIRLVIGVFLVMIVSVFMIDGLFSFCAANLFLGFLHKLGVWWITNVDLTHHFQTIVALSVILFGPILLWKLTSIVNAAIAVRAANSRKIEGSASKALNTLVPIAKPPESSLSASVIISAG